MSNPGGQPLDGAIGNFLDDLVADLRQWLGEEADAEITWSAPSDLDELAQDLGWWKGSRTQAPKGVLAAGAQLETWEELGRGGESESSKDSGYSRFALSFEKALEKHFGPADLDPASGPGEEPPGDWTRVTLELRRSSDQYPPIFCCFSPELRQAFRAPDPAAPFADADRPVRTGSPVSMDMLMDVEVPVRVSFGRTRIRMKELLNLNSGSLVELDRSLGDRVEILVNHRVIARGEVVAVDGNYGVRILELTSGGGAPEAS